MINDKLINIYITSELNKFNFNKTSLGYKYIKYAIKKEIYNEEVLENFTQKLYKEMENELNVAKSKIKWNIEKSIDFMYLTSNANILIDYFSLEINQKITPKLFIITMVENFFT